jgi:hypothetical protein
VRNLGRLQRSKAVVRLGAIATLVLGAAASTSPVSAQPPGPVASEVRSVVCSASQPGSGWVPDSDYVPPNACRKCQEAGRRLEATGRWRAYCWAFPPPAAILYRSCVACLHTDVEPGRLAVMGTDPAPPMTR